MSTKLNQIIAVEKGSKARSFGKITEAYQLLQKPAVLAGILRTCQPSDEDGEQYPPEATKVQVKADELIADVTTSLTGPDHVGAPARSKDAQPGRGSTRPRRRSDWPRTSWPRLPTRVDRRPVPTSRSRERDVPDRPHVVPTMAKAPTLGDGSSSCCAPSSTWCGSVTSER